MSKKAAKNEKAQATPVHEKYANVRLTNSIRERIEEAMVSKAISPRRKTLAKTKLDIVSKLIRSCFNDAEWAIYKKIPTAWMYPDSWLEFKVAGHTVRWNSDDTKATDHIFYLPYHLKSRTPVVALPHTHPIASDVSELVSEARKLDDDESKIRRDVRAMLYATSTTKALLTAWPECEEFVKPYVTPSGSGQQFTTALAISGERLRQLNISLGLVTGE
jgi:hypothetical protein